MNATCSRCNILYPYSDLTLLEFPDLDLVCKACQDCKPEAYTSPSRYHIPPLKVPKVLETCTCLGDRSRFCKSHIEE